MSIDASEAAQWVILLTVVVAVALREWITESRGLRFVPEAISVVTIPNGASPQFIKAFRLGWNAAMKTTAPHAHLHEWAVGLDQATGKSHVFCTIYGCPVQGSYVTECPTCHHEIVVPEAADDLD